MVNAGATASHGGSGLDDLLGAGIVVVDGKECTGWDLLAAGVVSGRWQQLERELSVGLGLIAVQAPADAAVAGVVREFRLERGLLSGEDLRVWMGARGLTLAAVKAVAARSLARASGGTPQAVVAAQVAAALPAELICTGALREMGFWLADRLLSAAATRAEGVEPLALQRPSVQRLVSEEASSVAGGARRESGVDRAGQLAAIAALDEAHREWEADVVGWREVARRLQEKKLEWCSFELDELVLASPGAAAEAARQLVEGSDPTRVAEVAGVPLGARTTVLADAPPALARVLVGAIVGDVIGPWRGDSAYVVARVRGRWLPHIAHEPSVVRAREELLSEVVARLRVGRVRWYERA